MKAVLDTNVLVSALLSRRGPPAKVVDAWLANAYVLVTSSALLAEFADVTSRPRVRRLISSPADAEDLLEQLSTRATVAEPAQSLSIVTDDPADNRVLEAALAGDVDHIVTGDDDLHRLGWAGRPRIVTPAEFLRILEAEGASS